MRYTCQCCEVMWLVMWLVHTGWQRSMVSTMPRCLASALQRTWAGTLPPMGYRCPTTGQSLRFVWLYVPAQYWTWNRNSAGSYTLCVQQRLGLSIYALTNHRTYTVILTKTVVTILPSHETTVYIIYRGRIHYRVQLVYTCETRLCLGVTFA